VEDRAASDQQCCWDKGNCRYHDAALGMHSISMKMPSKWAQARRDGEADRWNPQKYLFSDLNKYIFLVPCSE
jgi:hypothetical protein